MADNVITPIAMNIAEAFPDRSNFQMNFILSGSMLITAPAAILFGKLAQYIRKKQLLIFAYSLNIVSGILPAFSESLIVRMLYREAVDITCGRLRACVFSTIAELDQDEKVSNFPKRPNKQLTETTALRAIFSSSRKKQADSTYCRLALVSRL